MGGGRSCCFVVCCIVAFFLCFFLRQAWLSVLALEYWVWVLIDLMVLLVFTQTEDQCVTIDSPSSF